ncbi:Lipase 4 [Operophtera brumata]|uniref:Lipase 4 n=1 Tax=Operophtera brumata TaxID=104452 RepID=A0A0L7K4K3_OPEBR|nr:Lipase 4 [Operophtera brumata]
MISEVISEALETNLQVLSFNVEPKVLKSKNYNNKETRIQGVDKNLQEPLTSLKVPQKNHHDFDKVLKSLQDLFQDWPLNGPIVSKTLKNHQDFDKRLERLQDFLLTEENIQVFEETRPSPDSEQNEPLDQRIPRGSNFTQRHPLENTELKNSFQVTLLSVTARVARHGYTVREYTVITDDGYVLGLQRITSESVSQQDKEELRKLPVLLMHGLLMSAASWLDEDPRTGLAYLLAQAGHDVWLGNARGSYYSRRHVTLDPDSDSAYWQFCADEIGKYDLPASIDKVLNETGAVELNYIGFSQGGGTFFMMCSELPHYCKKANIMIALAPSGRHLSTKSPLFRKLSEFFENNEKALFDVGIYEVLPRNGLVQQLFNFFCRRSEFALQLCELFKGYFDGYHPGSITKDSLLNMVANFPSGTSVHNMARYGQIVRSKTIHKFDYGSQKNTQLYGSSKPPVYNLSAVTVPVFVIYGRNDGIVDIRDIKWLIPNLPNVIEAFEVEDPLWAHMDVAYSHYVPKLLYPKVNEYLMFNK